MEYITWELKNLDSLKEYIFDELIGEHKNTKDINEAINRYAVRYHEMQLKLLVLHNVSSMFSAEQMEQAFNDGIEAEQQRCGEFDIENYC